VISVLAAVAALAAGVAGVVLHAPELGVIAGGLGLVTGIAAAALAARLRDRERRVTELAGEATRLRTEMEALAALLETLPSRSNPSGVMMPPAYSRTPAREREAAKSRHPAASSPTTDDAPPGLVDEQHFTTLLHQRVASARRHLHPLSVVLFAVGGGPGLEQRLDTLAYAVLRTMRECDSLTRVNDLMLSAVLDGASEHGAVWAVERVRAALAESPDDHPVQLFAGIACYPTHALEPRALVTAAGRALEIARAGRASEVQVAEREA